MPRFASLSSVSLIPSSVLRASRLLASTLTVCSALALAACSTGPLRVSTEVQSFARPASALGAGPGASGAGAPIAWRGARYRFDVLPSQSGLNLAPLQGMTAAALSAHGLVRDEARARFAVQVSASLRSVWVDDGWGPAGWGAWNIGWRLGYGRGPWFGSIGSMGAASLPTSTYVRELRIAVLELASGQTVYETRARNESPNGQNDAIFGAMVNAALKDFPHAAAGWQRVEAELPVSSAPSAPSAPRSAPASASAAPASTWAAPASAGPAGSESTPVAPSSPGSGAGAAGAMDVRPAPVR
jgi:hypothetical protein